MSYRLEIEIQSSIEKIWNAWTSKAEAEKWLSPRANIEFVVGGKYEFFWNENPKIDSTLGCKIKTIFPAKYLQFEWQCKTEFFGMFQYPHKRTLIDVHLTS